MKTLILNVLLLLVCSSSIAASHNKLLYLNEYDLDGNGEVNQSEFEQGRKQRFDATDENHNGLVDENEYVFEYQNRMDKQLSEDRFERVKQAVARFKSLDKSDNQHIEWQEYQASGERNFKQFDTHQDSIVNHLDRKPENSSDVVNTTDKTPQQIEGAKNRLLQQAKRLLHMPTTHTSSGFFKKYDVDENASITKAEFDKVRLADFTRIDEDKNGWLSEQEYLFEYENRLDQEIARTRKGAIKQTHVRFNILDDDKNAQMTFAEYQLSGHRSFKRWDTNEDGIVSMLDPMPKERSNDEQNNTADAAK